MKREFIRKSIGGIVLIVLLASILLVMAICKNNKPISDKAEKEGLFTENFVKEKSVYYYEGNTLEGKIKTSDIIQPINFYIILKPNGSFMWSDAAYSSFRGVGNYTITDGVLTLTNDLGACGNENKYKFWIYEDRLEFIAEGSDGFNCVEVSNGEQFFLDKNPLGEEWKR